MTRNVAVLAFDLAVAIISILLFIATPVWLATREITPFEAIFMVIGSAAGAIVGTLKLHTIKSLDPSRRSSRA